MTVLKSFVSPSVRQALPVASAVILFASATFAGDLTGNLSDPDVGSPKRFGSDVSAFYLGLSGGYGSGGDDRFGLRAPAGVFEIGELDLTGSYGGIRGGWRGVLPTSIGRDYVYGFEVGYDFGTLDDNVTNQIGGDTVQGSSAISDILSLRIKNGLTNRKGSVLYFVSLGYVWGDIETTSSITSGSSRQAFEDSDRRGGFSASIGAEHKLSDNWSITGEYEYVQFQSKDVQFNSNFSTKSTPSYRGLRFGLNYAF
ncbi:outer membrane beta-barrel protein [uncultured Ruegeria sp.]|uniref:outer membrane protein n=1 Tax=uncultured Ruegeria sp. TaxID=259304 RepID=UPI00260E6F9A|nr:outer membrane beta-barrel protein [uncultured Ruegeria sp.]